MSGEKVLTGRQVGPGWGLLLPPQGPRTLRTVPQSLNRVRPQLPPWQPFGRPKSLFRGGTTDSAEPEIRVPTKHGPARGGSTGSGPDVQGRGRLEGARGRTDVCRRGEALAQNVLLPRASPPRPRPRPRPPANTLAERPPRPGPDAPNNGRGIVGSSPTATAPVTVRRRPDPIRPLRPRQALVVS